MRVRTLYGQLMLTTSIVLAAVLVLSIGAYFVMNVVHAHGDTRHRMLFVLPAVTNAVRRDQPVAVARAVRLAAESLHGGVTVVTASDTIVAHAGSEAPRAFIARVLADVDRRPRRFTFADTHVGRRDILVAFDPIYLHTGSSRVVVLNAPVVPAAPSFREVLPVLVAELLALLLAQVLWSFVIRRVTSPLEALTAWAGRLAGGDLRARVEPVEAVAELAALGDALQHMADSLAEESERREEFLAEVAHDLRTPLSVQRTVLMSLAGEASQKPAEVARLARQAQVETERLIRLVNGLLDMVRLERGQLLTTAIDLDLREPVAMAAAAFEVYARRQNVELAVDLGSAPVPAVGDPDRVTQIATNLIDNAVRHAGRGGRVTVETALDAEARLARLSVADTGAGVPEAVRRTMWQRFAPGRDAGHRTSGLGLAISRGLARAMGGDLELAPGARTCFVLTLPAAVGRG